MSKDIKKSDLFSLIDTIDENIREVFWVAQNVEPARRYRLQKLLLNCPSMVGVGWDENTAAKELTQLMQDMKEKRSIVEKVASDVAEYIWNLYKPTYTVSNYWSPIAPEERKSIVHRSSLNPENHRRSLAYAFYAMTFHARKQNLYSVVQYIADEADHKRGRFACYLDYCRGDTYSSFQHACPIPETARHRWICFPQKVRKALLDQLGISSMVNKILLKQERHTAEIEEKLSYLLHSMPTEAWNIDDFGRIATNELLQRLSSLDEDLRRYLRDAKMRLGAFYGKDVKREATASEKTS